MKMVPAYILNPELTPIQMKDAISERIHKLQALACFAQIEDLLDYSKENVDNFFWVQIGLLREVHELFTCFIQQADS